MKKSLVSAIAALGIAVGIAPGYTGEKASQPKRNNPRSVQELYVNPLPVHYSVEKCRHDGEFDLVRLADKAKLEEGWIYVEYNDGRKVWHENGLDETVDQQVFDMEVLEDLLEHSNEVKRMSFYHFHPIYEDGNDLSQTPSMKDFISDLRLLEKIHDKKPELLDKLDMRIAVSAGVYTVKYNPDIVMNNAMRAEHYLNLSKISNAKNGFEEEKSREFDFSQNNRKNFPEECKRFADTFSTANMDITFEGRK